MTPKELSRLVPCYYGGDDGDNKYDRYFGWSPGDDYMKGVPKDDNGGWDSGLVFDSWKKFIDEWRDLDLELNVIVDFYFRVAADSVACDNCDSGYNPETEVIEKDFYDFDDTGRRWCDKITQDEVDVLVEQRRLVVLTDGKWKKPDPYPTAAEVNACQNSGHGHRFMQHDAINRFILIETRATRLGVYGLCSKCGGKMYIQTSPDRLDLALWVAHPRKGCTRGIIVKNIVEQDFDDIKSLLKRHLNQTLKRFAWATDPKGSE